MNSNNELVIPSSDSSDSQTSRKRGFFIIEPAVFLIFFALELSDAVLQSQVIYQACIVVFHYNNSDCVLLGTSEANERTQEIETDVQPYAANILMSRSLMEGIIPAICSLFIGPWSDKFGRKPVILAAFTGYCSVYILSSAIAFLSTRYLINPWLYAFAIIPVSLSGGSCSLITGIFCYITDIAKAKDVAYRMVIVEATLYAGLMVGSLSSSYLLAVTNPVTVFLVSGIAVVLSLFYVAFFVQESLEPDKIDPGPKIRGLFKWELVKDMLKTCFEQRPNYDRMIIWLIISTLGISIFIMEGTMNVFFLFVREKFEWTIKDYTLYDAASIIIQILGNVIGVFFLQKVLRLSIISLALLALGSSVLDTVIKATAIYPWHLYLSIGVGILKGVAGPMCRAILSKVVPLSEIGKVYSLTTSVESILPLAAPPLYTAIYNATLKIYPGAFSILSSGLFFICYIFLTIVFGIQQSYPNTTYEAIG